ncbi:MAG TPA: ABC transporter substrate-binding protein [Burkholderiales bacterium]|jgi:ABC-type nitrate/sulfonate/bicarbonate transport system substrate-binding protein|nr:ABC transporter substrate-binding protein [Burkholderiales bacterium]
MKRLRIILFRAAYNLPVTSGIARGVFAKHGLELDIVYTRGSQMTSASLLSDDCQIGALAADDVVYEVEEHGSDLFLFMGLHGGILQLVARPAIKSARDLAGARLGVDDPNSGFALVAHKILQRMGLKRTDYETVAMGGQEFRARAIAEGKIDVTLSTPPFSLDLADRGFTLLAHARDYVPRYQASCAVATRRWAASNADALAAYARAYRESLAWTLANRDAGIKQLRDEFSLTQQLAEATFDALADPRDGLFPDAHIDMPGIDTVLALRVEAGLLPDPRPAASKYCG